MRGAVLSSTTHEIGDGVVIAPLAALGCEAIQDGRFRLFKVRKGQDPLRRSFLFSGFRHLAAASLDRRNQNQPAAIEWG